MLVAMGMVCMPIGGARIDGPVAEAAPLATIGPVAQPWLVSPVRLVVVCIVLLLASWLNRHHKRQLLLEGTGQ